MQAIQASGLLVNWEGFRNGFQVVQKHHTTRFADAGRDFGPSPSKCARINS